MPDGLRFHTDKQLLEAIRERKQDALAILFDKYAPLVQLTIGRIVKNEELCEEILQKTFLLAWNSPSTLSPDQPLSLSLMALGRQLAVKLKGPEKPVINNEIQSSAASVYNPETVPEDMKTSPLRDQQLARHEALTLVFVKGYSIEEAANYFNMSKEELKIKLRAELFSFRGTTAK
jgi:DNA-directed RNA polymerase specialized sigma24 family protein